MGRLHAALQKKGDQARPRAAAAATATSPAPAGPASGDTAAGLSAHAVYVPAALRGDVDPHLVAVADPESPAAESYRVLRENLLGFAAANRWKVFAVTSASSGEGRSLTAANLACSLAENPDRKIALVDGDLRSPSLHALLGVDNQRGLSDYLAGGTLLEMALQRSRLSNLWVLPAGRPPANPAELITSKRTDDLLARLRRDYDVVILDTPSVATATDAASLAAHADGALLVVRIGRTQREQAQQAADVLQNAKVHVLGTVVTAA